MGPTRPLPSSLLPTFYFRTNRDPGRTRFRTSELCVWYTYLLPLPSLSVGPTNSSQHSRSHVHPVPLGPAQRPVHSCSHGGKEGVRESRPPLRSGTPDVGSLPRGTRGSLWRPKVGPDGGGGLRGPVESGTGITDVVRGRHPECLEVVRVVGVDVPPPGVGGAGGGRPRTTLWSGPGHAVGPAFVDGGRGRTEVVRPRRGPGRWGPPLGAGTAGDGSRPVALVSVPRSQEIPVGGELCPVVVPAVVREGRTPRVRRAGDDDPVRTKGVSLAPRPPGEDPGPKPTSPIFRSPRPFPQKGGERT